MSKYIKAEDVREKMYHEAFDTDTDMQKWDSGCWIRYKLFENVIESVEGVDVDQIIDEHIREYLAARRLVLVNAEAPTNVRTLRAGATVSDDVSRKMNDKERFQKYVKDLIIESIKPKLQEILVLKQQRNPAIGVTMYLADLKVILPIEDLTEEQDGTR